MHGDNKCLQKLLQGTGIIVSCFWGRLIKQIPKIAEERADQNISLEEILYSVLEATFEDCACHM